MDPRSNDCPINSAVIPDGLRQQADPGPKYPGIAD
jgi:hypothetical protein